MARIEDGKVIRRNVCVYVYLCVQIKKSQIGRLGMPAGRHFSLLCVIEVAPL